MFICDLFVRQIKLRWSIELNTMKIELRKQILIDNRNDFIQRLQNEDE